MSDDGRRDYKKLICNKIGSSKPMSILEIIKVFYPARYKKMMENELKMDGLFTSKEWLKILTESRKSHELYLKRIKKAGSR